MKGETDPHNLLIALLGSSLHCRVKHRQSTLTSSLKDSTTPKSNTNRKSSALHKTLQIINNNLCWILGNTLELLEPCHVNHHILWPFRTHFPVLHANTVPNFRWFFLFFFGGLKLCESKQQIKRFSFSTEINDNPKKNHRKTLFVLWFMDEEHD